MIGVVFPVGADRIAGTVHSVRGVEGSGPSEVAVRVRWDRPGGLGTRKLS